MPTSDPRVLPFLVRGALCLPLLLAAACRSAEVQDEGDTAWLIQHARYSEAVDRAQQEAAERPGDAGAEERLRDARVAFVLDVGRRAVFAGSPEQGLACFQHALEISPGNQVVQLWIEKTRHQLASEWMDRATEFYASSRLEDAKGAYEKVLEYVPDHTEAKAGLARVLLLKNYREGQSQSYFVNGVRTFRDFLLHQSRRDFYTSYDYDKANDRAKERGTEVDVMLAEERLAQAHGLEQQGLYHAARNEYRLSLRVDPSSAAAQEGLDRMERETRADRFLTQAEISLRRGEFEKAKGLVEQGSALTELQADRTGKLSAEIEDARLRKLYDDARAKERDYRFPEAVEAYDRLLAEVESFEDAVKRRETIQEFIHLAEDYYQRALQAPTDEETADYLRRIRVFWPEYLDVDQRLAVIEQRLAEKAGTPPGG